jgi:GAF domain-containing protein
MLRGNSAMNAGVWSRERRMERLSAQLATCRTGPDLDATLALIAAELRAEKICLSRWSAAEELVETLAENGGDTGETRFALQEYPLTERVIGRQEAAEVIVSDPQADPAEVELLLSLEQGALLIVPVVSFGVTLGIVEAYRTSTEPWTREEVSSARTIANQFAPVLQAIAPDPWDPGPLPGQEG